MQKIFDSIVDFNGNIWCKAHVDTYNNYTSHYNSIKGTGKLSEDERDAVLDRRHQFYVAVMLLYKKAA